MLTQIVTTKLEIAKVAACDQTGLATRAKLVHFSLDSDACFIDAILRFGSTAGMAKIELAHQGRKPRVEVEGGPIHYAIFF